VNGERPLHVRVAEALGCKPEGGPDEWLCGCKDRTHGVGGPCRHPWEVPAYDTDWAATGPLIERYGITIEAPERHCDDPEGHDCLQWKAYHPDSCFKCHKYPEPPCASGECDLDPRGAGAAPLIAVCNLILALHEAGKLPAAAA
jgi:hypothetical protein